MMQLAEFNTVVSDFSTAFSSNIRYVFLAFNCIKFNKLHHVTLPFSLRMLLLLTELLYLSDSIRQYFISRRDDNTRRKKDSIGAHRNKNKIRRRLMRVSNYFLYIFDYFNKVMIAESCKRC